MDGRKHKEWQALREQVLQHPFLLVKDTPSEWQAIYLELPNKAKSYRFTETYDFNETEVFFSNDKGEREVSENTSYLAQLMKVKELNELFEESCWARSFQPSCFMLTPPMFNNIYKGALGEVCGKHLLQHSFDIALLELDLDEFEYFDYKTDDGIYVDFKLWNDNVSIEASDIISKIETKMSNIKAKKVLIINILGGSSTRFNPIVSTDNRIVEVPFLCRNDQIDKDAMAFILKELQL